jgi:hypothetical protein
VVIDEGSSLVTVAVMIVQKLVDAPHVPPAEFDAKQLQKYCVPGVSPIMFVEKTPRDTVPILALLLHDSGLVPPLVKPQ